MTTINGGPHRAREFQALFEIFEGREFEALGGLRWVYIRPGEPDATLEGRNNNLLTVTLHPIADLPVVHEHLEFDIEKIIELIREKLPQLCH